VFYSEVTKELLKAHGPTDEKKIQKALGIQAAAKEEEAT